jgi:hypothetical protein
MPRLARLLLVLLALTAAACGGGGGTTSQPATTPPALATLDVVRTGGIAADRTELHLRPGDPRLTAAQAALGLPLPASSASTSGAADAFGYTVTAILSDGSGATYAFDQGQVPDDLKKLDTWLGTAM